MVFELDDVPAGCKPQTGGLGEFRSVAALPPSDLVSYFRANPESADRVLQQSYDKREVAMLNHLTDRWSQPLAAEIVSQILQYFRPDR